MTICWKINILHSEREKERERERERERGMVLFQKMGAKSWERTGPTLWLISLSLPSPDLSKFKPEKKKKKNNNNNKSSSFIIPSRSHEQSNLNKATWDVGLWFPEETRETPPPPSSKKIPNFSFFQSWYMGRGVLWPQVLQQYIIVFPRRQEPDTSGPEFTWDSKSGLGKLRGGGALIVVLNVPCQPLLIGSAHCTIHTPKHTELNSNS